jgi:hypothetical protein
MVLKNKNKTQKPENKNLPGLDLFDSKIDYFIDLKSVSKLIFSLPLKSSDFSLLSQTRN